MIIPEKKDLDLYKYIQDRIEYYATAQSKVTSIEETKKILKMLGKMRDEWLETYAFTIQEANSLVFVQNRF